MPMLTSNIVELTDHIIDPILRQLIQRIVFTLGFQNIFNNNIIIKTKYASISDTSDGEQNAKLRESKIVAEANIQSHPGNVKWDVTTFSHTPAYGIGNNINRKYPIFNDREFGIALYEQAAPCSIMMQCTMHFLDKAMAYSAPLQLFNHYRDGSILQVSDLLYDYKLSNDIAYVLGQIYNHKKYTKSFSTFYEYLQYWSGGKISMNKNRNGDRPELVVLKESAECMVSVEYNDDEPGTETTDASPNSFTIPFSLTCQFNMPNTSILTYPIMIENKLLPIESIPIPTSIRKRVALASMPDVAMDEFFAAYKHIHPEYVQIPYYDDWQVPPVCIARAYTQTPFLIAACSIDIDQEVNTVDLKTNLGDGFSLPIQVQEIIARQEEINPGGSFDPDCIFNIAVYYGDEPLASVELNMTPDWCVTYKGRKLNQVYHFVISEITDIAKLNPMYYPILLENYSWLSLHIIRQLHFLIKNGSFRVIANNAAGLGWWIDENGYIYDTKTGKCIGRIGEDGSWIDLDGTVHYGTLENTVEANSHGSSIISRIFKYSIVTVLGRS